MFIIFPAKVKKGKASSAKESIPENTRWAAITAKISGSKLKNAVMIEAIPIPTDIGTPVRSIVKNTPKRIKVDCIIIIKPPSYLLWSPDITECT